MHPAVAPAGGCEPGGVFSKKSCVRMGSTALPCGLLLICAEFLLGFPGRSRVGDQGGQHLLIWKGQEMSHMAIMTRVNRMARAYLTHPGHAGMGQVPLSDGNWLPRSWMEGLGMDLRTLYAVTYCGLWHPPVAVLSPVLCPAGLWDAAAALVRFVLAGPHSTGDSVHLQDLALYHAAHGT